MGFYTKAGLLGQIMHTIPTAGIKQKYYVIPVGFLLH